MLSHLVYVSKRKANCTNLEIENILEACKKNNPDLEITGVLLYSETKFIQYVEGDYKKIMALFDKIKLDKRHENVALISVGPIKEKIFPSWHMGNKMVSQNDVEFRTDINTDDKHLFMNILNGKEQKGEKVQMLIKKLF
jgi:hypothetical protein